MPPALVSARRTNLMSVGELPYSPPEPSSCLGIATLFPSKELRAAHAAGRARTMRLPISGICSRFDSGDIESHVLLQVSAPADPDRPRLILNCVQTYGSYPFDASDTVLVLSLIRAIAVRC